MSDVVWGRAKTSFQRRESPRLQGGRLTLQRKPALADHWGDCCSDHLWRDCAWKAERVWDEDQQTRITVAHLH